MFTIIGFFGVQTAYNRPDLWSHLNKGDVCYVALCIKLLYANQRPVSVNDLS